MFTTLKSFSLVVAAVVLAASQFASASIIRDDVPDSSYLTYAQNSMFDSTVSVWVQKADGWYGASGVVISVDTSSSSPLVLFSGHQLKGATGGIMVFAGADAYHSTDFAYADAWVQNPGYSETPGTGVDLALLHLTKSFSSAAQLYRGTDQPGTMLYMADFGYYGTASTGPVGFDGLKRAGTNVGAELGEGLIAPEFWVCPFDWPDSYRTTLLEWMTAPSSSGCPYYNSDGLVVGIDSGVYGNYGYGSAAYGIRTSLYTDWIDSTAATFVPEPGSLGLLALGAFGLLKRRRTTTGARTGLLSVQPQTQRDDARQGGSIL
jgi:V8-like Glu-specific endopeptidase